MPSATATPTRLRVNNVLQPTISELKQLKLLDGTLQDAPLLPIVPKVATGPAPAGSAAPRTDNRYGTTVRRIPLTGGFNFETLIFNVQPYALSRDQMSRLLRHSSGMGAVSGTMEDAAKGDVLNPDFALTSVGGSWQRPNPVRQSVSRPGSSGANTSVDVGLPGIVAWLGSYDTTASLTLMRRDGSLSPTGDWSFEDHDLNDVGRIDTHELDVVQSAEIGGSLTVTGMVTALKDLTIAGTSNLYKLVVAGPAVFSGPVRFDDNVNVVAPAGSAQRVKVTVGDGSEKSVISGDAVFTPALTTPGARTSNHGTHFDTDTKATVGGACQLNLALAQDADSGRLMICSDSLWAHVSFDLSILQPPPRESSCSPEGSMTLFADGTIAVCKEKKWATAFQPGTPGRSCSTRGALSSHTTSQGVSSLLVCQGGVWTEDIYSRPMLSAVSRGAACRTDEINAVARSNASVTAGVLMCTSNGRGGATWELPFETYKKVAFIDYNEYLQTSFFWQNPDPRGLDGGDRITPLDQRGFLLKRVVNGTVVGTTVGAFARYWGPHPYSSLLFTPRLADENPATIWGSPTWGAPCNSSFLLSPDQRPSLTNKGCGNDWTNPLDADPTGTHPGLSCTNGGPGLNPDVQDIYWWTGDNSLRINYHSQGGGWGECTITMYRISTKTFVMNP